MTTAVRMALRAKARLGRWDDRMFNGHPSNVTPAVRAFIRRGVAAGLVCTATRDGQHAEHSFHKTTPGRAADMGLPVSLIATRRGRARLVAFQRREAYGPIHHAELFGPDNRANVRDGRIITLAEGTALENQHDNHVHGAF